MRGLGSTYKRGSVWWIQYCHRGKVFKESSHSDRETAARNLLKKRIGEIGRGKLIGPTEERVTFEDMAAGLVADYEMNGKRSLRTAKAAIQHLRAWFGNDRALDITADRIKAYTVQRLKDGAKPASVNYELATLRRTFSLMVKAGRLSSKPYIDLLEVDNARQGFIDPADFARLCAALPEHLRDPVAFLYLSCWRPVEMKSLQWADIDLPGRAVRLRSANSKTKRPRLLKLDGRLLEIIERAHAARRLDCPFVFHHDGQRLVDFSKAWRTACDKVKLGGILLYDCRRSGIRNMVRAGIPERVCMAVSGHRTRSIFDRYNIVSEGDLDQAAAKIDEYLNAHEGDAPKVALLPRRDATAA